MQLRPHQLEALDKMNTKRLGQVIVPTGGGKTMCMIEDAKKRFTQSRSSAASDVYKRQATKTTPT